MKWITFAVPCYNSQSVLEKCLDSFLVEEALERIEVVVVNDGSKDRTSEIAHRYERRYPGVYRVIDKENGGHGSGINAALKISQGVFFKVIDSDDWIVGNNLPLLLQALEDTDADVVINAYQSVNKKTGALLSYTIACDCAQRSISVADMMRLYSNIRDCCTFHGITYRTDILRGANHPLTERVFYEDQEYATVYFDHVQKVLLLPFYLYQYQVGDENQSIAIPNQIKRISDIRIVAENILEYWKNSRRMTPETEEYFTQKMSVLVTSYFATALVKNSDKKAGRRLAMNFYEYLAVQRPILLRCTAKKWWMLRIMNRLNLSPSLYQYLLDTPIYKKIRGIWTK